MVGEMAEYWKTVLTICYDLGVMWSSIQPLRLVPSWRKLGQDLDGDYFLHFSDLKKHVTGLIWCL
jgi:hypothetical protein